MGWWPSKLIVLLNLIVLLGYSLIDCVVAGQILSAVSPNGSLSVVVGNDPMFMIRSFLLNRFTRHHHSCCNYLGYLYVRYTDISCLRTVCLPFSA